MTRLERDVWIAVYAAEYVRGASLAISGCVTADDRSRSACQQATLAVESMRGSVPLRIVEELEKS